MEKKGQVFFFTLMLGITFIVLALALAGPTRSFIDSYRANITDEGQPGLDCQNDSISNFDKGACIVTDLSIFHFIGGLIFLAGAVITARAVSQ